MKAIALAVIALAPCAAPAAPALRNWFGDPFFQVRSGFAGCPQPRGPFGTEEDRLAETHHRSERGTRCWLEKKCSKPNSYLYDPEIAAAIRARFESTRRFRDATLWVTVQGRRAWVEGCVASKREEDALARFMRGVPDVEVMIVNVSHARGAEPPYRTRR